MSGILKSVGVYLFSHEPGDVVMDMVRYQVFISSTKEDLENERDIIIKATLEMGHIPVGMEMFNAGDDDQWTTIKDTIDKSDYYVIIVAHRYGSTTENGISYTEQEYNYAIERNIPVIPLIISDNASWPESKRQPDKYEQLINFKKRLKSKLMSEWNNANELDAVYTKSLMRVISRKPGIGWISGSERSDPKIAQQISLLLKENRELRNKLKRLDDKTAENSYMKSIYDSLQRESSLGLDRANRDFVVSTNTIFEEIANTIIVSPTTVSVIGRALMQRFDIRFKRAYEEIYELLSKFRLMALLDVKTAVTTDAKGRSKVNTWFELSQLGLQYLRWSEDQPPD